MVNSDSELLSAPERRNSNAVLNLPSLTLHSGVPQGYALQKNNILLEPLSSPMPHASEVMPTPSGLPGYPEDAATVPDYEPHLHFSGSYDRQDAVEVIVTHDSPHASKQDFSPASPTGYLLSEHASEYPEEELHSDLEIPMTPVTPLSEISDISEESEASTAPTEADLTEPETQSVIPGPQTSPKAESLTPSAEADGSDSREFPGAWLWWDELQDKNTTPVPPSTPVDEVVSSEPLVAPSQPSPTSDPDRPTSFRLPDLVSHCHFPLTYHPDGDEVAALSDRWLDEGCPELSPKKRKALYGLKAGELTAYCYPTCDKEHLRVVSDFMNYLFHLDNISDGMMKRDTDVLADVVMNALWFPHVYLPTHAPGKEQPDEEISAGKLARDYWSRCIKDAGPGVQARFKESLELFFEAVNVQAADRDSGIIPDIESYIDVRRDTSGCKPVFDLIEYALQINLPDEVVNHPVIKALNQGTNDLVTWSNDIFSYNVEQSRGDTHNMIVILMAYHGMNLQEAVDHVGELCRQTIDTFCENQKRVPSFGDEKLDRDVAGYVQGLQDWIVGSLHWSFMSERYFGKAGAEVKKHRNVVLLPKRDA